MAYKRTNISFFELNNAAYASATVAFFQVDPATNDRLTSLITLYADTSSAVTLPNPYQLDSGGKFATPAYALERFIAVINDVNGVVTETGVWEPSLSTADVLAAAASAAAAAASQVDAAASATVASAASVVAVAAAAQAIAAVGSVLVTGTDSTPANLNAKVDVTGFISKRVDNPAGNATLVIGAIVATQAQIQARATNDAALTPASLAFLGASDTTSGIVRLATPAETVSATVTNAALTPAGAANTIHAVQALIGVAVNVSSGANVTMLPNLKYRFTATVAAQVNFPTTMAAGTANIIENGCTTGATMTIGRGGMTIDTVAGNDTMTRYGDSILYACTITATAVQSTFIGVLPAVT